MGRSTYPPLYQRLVEDIVPGGGLGGSVTLVFSTGDWEAMAQDAFEIKYVTGTKVYLDDSGETVITIAYVEIPTPISRVL